MIPVIDKPTAIPNGAARLIVMKTLRALSSMVGLLAAVGYLTIYTSTAQAERPNVIVIMSDDQGGGDYGFMGNKIIRTPALDAMAKKSGLLTKFYVSPVCAPTRASLMTGRYNYRTRCIDTYVGRAMMDPEEVTIAELLRAADYRGPIALGALRRDDDRFGVPIAEWRAPREDETRKLMAAIAHVRRTIAGGR